MIAGRTPPFVELVFDLQADSGLCKSYKDVSRATPQGPGDASNTTEDSRLRSISYNERGPIAERGVGKAPARDLQRTVVYLA
jgi:hypothetical protein